jgi:branched-chain amino acid transport system substrate-binding protein
VKVQLKLVSVISLFIQLLAVGLSTPSQAATDVTIAYQGPMTGSEATAGIAALNGIKYAISKFNTTSLNYKVQLATIDDQADPAIAGRLFPAAIADKDIIGVIGPLYSGATKATLPHLIGAGLVAISPAASNYSLTNQQSSSSGYPVFQRVIGVNFGAPLAKHSIKGVTSPKVYIVDALENYSGPQTNAVKETLTTLNASVAGTQDVSGELTDFTPLLAKIKSTGANVIIYLGYDSGAAVFVKQIRDAGLTATFAAGGVSFGKDFSKLAGKASEGARVTTNALGSISQISPTLEADFKKVTGFNSDTYSLEAIDATNIMLSCIGKGNVTRATLLKCVREFKGKSILGAEISFDSNGDISGNHTYVGEVKNSLIQFTDPITNEPVIQKPADTSDARIDLLSISARTISPGEKVTWNFEVTVQPGWIKGIYVYLVDGQNQTRQLTIDGSLRFKGYMVEKAETYKAELTLQTHSGLAPGTYAVANFCVEGLKRDCVTDPRYANIHDPSRKNRSVNLEEFSFQVKDTGSNLREDPLKISKITAKKKAYSPGEVIVYEVEAIGKMSFVQANMYLTVGDVSVGAYCQVSYFSNCSYIQEKEKGTAKITFSIPIPEDFPAGKIELTSIYISSDAVALTSNDSTIISTAAWNSWFSYSNKAVTGVNGTSLPSSEAFDFALYSATILDTGGAANRPPTWSNLAWKSNKVNAGSEAILTLDVNSYQRFLSAIYLYNLVSTSGNQIYLKDIAPSLISTDSSQGIYPLKKSGQYQIKVTIPRLAKAGSYRLGQLTVEATNCQANTIVEWTQKLNSGNGQCQNLNSWQTTYNGGSVQGLNWAGSEKTSALILEILPPLKPQLPQLKVISNESSSIKIDYPADYEIECEFSSDKGSLLHQQVSKGQSNDGVNHLIISDLKPDSTVKLTGTCTGVDGLKSDSTIVEFKTSKPTPPAVPKLSTVEVGEDSAKFEFNYREGFKYQVKGNSGEVTITNGAIEFKKLPPDSKIEFQLSITDPYGQTTTGDPITFSTNRPKPPANPVIQLESKSQTRVSVSMKFEPQFEYEVTSTRGSISIIGSKINISGLLAGEKFTLLVIAKDKFLQTGISKESYQTDLPSAPRAPSLVSKSILTNELTVLVSQQEGTELVIKSSAGVLAISGNTVKVTNLAPKSSVTFSAYSIDQFGQLSSVVTKSYTTRAAAPQKTLTCTNGKTTKVVIATNPVCPPGYKKK